MLIGAGQKEYVLSVEPFEASDRIARHRLVGMTNVRHSIGVGDRGRDVELLAGGHTKPRLRAGS